MKITINIFRITLNPLTFRHFHNENLLRGIYSSDAVPQCHVILYCGGCCVRRADVE